MERNRTRRKNTRMRIPPDKSSWQLLKIQASRQDAESLSDVLFALGGVSVSFENQDEGTSKEKPIYRFAAGQKEGFSEGPELWECCSVTALFPQGAKQKLLLKTIRAAMRWKQTPVFTVLSLRDQNWVEETQKQWNPVRVGKRLWIVPSRHAGADFGKNAILIKLDPGLAFGTGTHPTTRLCLEMLEQRVRKNDEVLDYGCGSGILAIGALKMGASRAIGVDIDPQALQASGRNALENQVSLDLYAHGKTPSFQADLLVANILLNPLLELKPLFLKHTHDKSRILLSGILSSQVDPLISGFAPEFDFEAPAISENWACLFGVRRQRLKKNR